VSRRHIAMALGLLTTAVSGHAAVAPIESRQVADSIAMADLPGGKYVMGTNSVDEHEQQTYPARHVTIKPFRIAKTDVTFDQYDQYARKTGHLLPQDEGFGRGTRPVINLDRAEVDGFIAWLNAGTGRHFRLPSEAEWEYAARGGTTTPYFWGTAPSNDYANLASDGGRDHYLTTAPVASFLPNGFGLYDMVGNVWQRVEDCRHPTMEGAPVDGRPWLGAACDSRMMRGGWYGSFTRGSQVTTRTAVADEFRSMGVGFRLAEDMPGR
jgi:formylglycine-generating enzyme required for sulfatase activity